MKLLLVEDNVEFALWLSKALQAERFDVDCVHDGSAAIDMAYVACGRFDGFWEEGLNPWDMAAGRLLIEEAGGWVTDYSGDPFSIYRPPVCASNGKIHNEMLAVLD